MLLPLAPENRRSVVTNSNFQKKFISTNGLKLRYLDWGLEGKPPLICLHGHTGQAHIWDEFAEAVSPYYHVYALDQRGHGDSEWAPDGYERDRFVEDLSSFIDALNLQRITLVGLSMGGWHSILYTPDNQERVDRIILVDIGPEPNQSAISRSNRPPTPLAFSTVQEAIIWARQTNLWVTDVRLEKDILDRMNQQTDGSWKWKADPALYNTPLTDMQRTESVERYWRSFRAIQNPILEVRGKESSTVSDLTIERMANSNPNFSYVDIEGAGHVVTVDKPYEFINATKGFLGLDGS